MLILEYVEEKKIGVGDQMGWATAHFQFCVMTLQWCRDRRGAAYTAGTSTRMTEDLRSSAQGSARGGLSRQTSLGSLSQQTSCGPAFFNVRPHLMGETRFFVCFEKPF